MTGNELTTLHFSCACNKVTGCANVPTARLPLPLDLCHCNICRHQSGLLCALCFLLPDGTTDWHFEGPIVDYKSSETAMRSFCDHCGANIYFKDSEKPRPHICSGVLKGVDGVLELGKHIFMPAAKDGGLAVWFSDIPAYEGRSSEIKPVEYQKTQRTNSTNDGTTELQAYCQCRGVQFKITKPDKMSYAMSSPWPDLIKPYISESSKNENDAKWWLRANGTKYLAGTCACTSCRLTSGSDIQTWAFIPKSNILQLNGKPLRFDMGTLKQYQSSEGVYREFCSKCGATVFWHCDERPDLFDVSVGLFDAQEGSRVESWLDWWTDRVSFEEEARNKDLVARLTVGMKRWANTRPSLINGKNVQTGKEVENASL
ncbi:hypothetical protein N7G274_000747 [Stereocaulon virgatum]|uniref:CENP-V/GFA domain-containing protein n=1 Tax=Stereocaulon virgatum TaxID=373712 RepID=A0ABR4APR1_9LECA